MNNMTLIASILYEYIFTKRAEYGNTYNKLDEIPIPILKMKLKGSNWSKNLLNIVNLTIFLGVVDTFIGIEEILTFMLIETVVSWSIKFTTIHSVLLLIQFLCYTIIIQ